MLLTLTDHLTCPVCGPSAGLILLMEEASERRVLRGALGCPVCRTQYPIADRVADLRVDRSVLPGDASAAADAQGRADPAQLALRVGGLMGLGEGRGFALVDGPAALPVADALEPLVTDYEIVVPITPAQTRDAAGMTLSALLDSGALPVGDRTMRAVAYVGGIPGAERLGELVRATRPTGRLVIEAQSADDASERSARLDEVAARLAERGAEVRARDATGVVAVVL